MGDDIETVHGIVRIPDNFPDKDVAGRRFRVNVRLVHTTWRKGAELCYELTCLTLGKAMAPERRTGQVTDDHIT